MLLITYVYDAMIGNLPAILFYSIVFYPFLTLLNDLITNICFVQRFENVENQISDSHALKLGL